MIDLYFAPTPNGWKVSVMLEEIGLPYSVKGVDLGAGEQFEPGFLAISPNAKIPAIVDHKPKGSQLPLTVFETGAILIYLAEKTGQLLPDSLADRKAVLEWLFWQASSLGPTMGQHGHFKLYAPHRIEYAQERFYDETVRLFGVLDAQLGRNEYIAGRTYSIADIAVFPWAQIYRAQGIDLPSFQHVLRWYEALKQRPALRKGMALAREELRAWSRGNPAAG